MKRIGKFAFLSLLLPLIASCAKTNTSTNTGEKSSSAPVASESAKPSTKEESSSKDSKDDTFVMEAEYTDLYEADGTPKAGHGYSGGADGADMVQKDSDGSAKASNGYWVGYLYNKGLSLNFVFNSTKAVKGVTLVVRLSCEIKDMELTPDLWAIRVNDTNSNSRGIEYGSFALAGASTSDSDGYVRPFTDRTSAVTIDLVEGENHIDLVTVNDITMGGTMYATAPMVDCVKLSHLSGSTLSYTEHKENLAAFEE